jgi:hypothetical protein
MTYILAVRVLPVTYCDVADEQWLELIQHCCSDSLGDNFESSLGLDTFDVRQALCLMTGIADWPGTGGFDVERRL